MKLDNIQELKPKSEERDAAEAAVKTLIEYIGEDPSREGLVETPARVVRAFAEHFSGYHVDPTSILQKRFEADGYDGPIVLEDIDFVSHCEHHLAPFFGKVKISYVPNGRVVGLSKLARLVDVFAKRLQLQERMTLQIAQTIRDVLEPKAVLVEVKASHSCLNFRGANKHCAEMSTRSSFGDIGLL